MAKLFSQRNAPEPATLRYNIPDEVKSRFLHTLQHKTRGRFEDILSELEPRFLMAYGFLCWPSYEATRRSRNPVIEHFLCSETEKSLDFIEAVFQTYSYIRECFTTYNELVETTNEIFRESGVGYALTPMRRWETGEDAVIPGVPVPSKKVAYDYPQAIVKSSQYEHKEIIEPALQVLGDRRFHVANTELLKAHQAYREGKFDDVFTNGCASLESVLKTICDARKWAYDRDKDTLSTLVRICKDEGLFPAFYAPMLESSGTVRNKLGAAHGRGPTPLHSPGDPHVNHFLQLISAHMLMLIRLANL